ncbi:MAG: RagB/SusD family nutrient uptake outer membrane protein [Sediminibacterium sp.]|nr:RagB/SusD family nutrient uptake outer membrane protein [Sediminibacterium sp.]
MITKFALPFLAVLVMMGCTKLNENLGSTLTNAQVSNALGSAGTGLLLSAAYADIGGPLTGQDQVFSLMENTTDESLVPTRGGDWDDNGVWRVLHNHTWNADHGQVLSVFNNLNKINFDATNVLGFNPSAQQAAEAKFLRALALYYLLDLYGQFPIRNPGDNLLLPPTVKSGADGATYIIGELEGIVANLPDGPSDKANKDAARTLLMKCYLQRGTWANRAAPTFDAADLAKVISLGNTIINSGKYSYESNYFNNFSPTNDNSKEAIFRYNNTSGVSANNSGMGVRWNMTLHYNSYTPSNPNAGWNGFSTIGDFYASFNTTQTPTAYGPADTIFDTRLGGRDFQNSKKISGINPGFLVNQQFNENGVALKDRKGNPLAYDKTIAANMIETGNNLEVTGIRIVKYAPDYSQYGGGPAGNDLMIFRYPDVVLMVAEARMRNNDAAGALTMVNALRAARGAAPLASMTLANPNLVNDPNTLISERGRELYWESVRRTDLQRFGIYLKPWQYKPTDDAKYLLFPIPNQALAANPNLKQNSGY